MRALLVCGLCLTAGVLMASDRIKIQPAVKAGDIVKQALTVQAIVGGAYESEVKATILAEAKKVEAGRIDWLVTFDGVEVVVNGAPFPVAPPPAEVATKPTMELIDLKGGFAEIETKRLFMAITFFAPAEEIGAGESYKLDLAGDKEKGIPGFLVDGKFVGPEKVGEADAFKFEIKLKEKEGGEGFTSETSFWVTSSGVILKLEGKLAGLPVPVVASTATATFKASAKS